MWPQVQPRNVQRTGQDPARQVWLINEDLDHNDRELEGIRDAIKSTNKILSGLLVATTSAAILGALNLLFGAV